MKIHHIGYYVENIEESQKDFEKLGWKKSSPKTFDEVRKIFIQFMNNGDDWIIELVQPAEGCKIFSKRLKSLGNTPYHICYECNDIEEKISELEKENFMLIHAPQIAPAIDNRRVAFLYSATVGLIEIVEKGV